MAMASARLERATEDRSERRDSSTHSDISADPVEAADAKLLRIYLRDHFAGSRLGLDLARRSAERNEGTLLGDYLKRFVAELELDRRVLRQVMSSIGARPNRLKQTGAWLTEKVARLKLNGGSFGYSKLSRLLELESLMIGVRGKLGMWRVLAELGDERLDRVEIAGAFTRAIKQHAALERFRLDAAREAFESRAREAEAGDGAAPIWASAAGAGAH